MSTNSPDRGRFDQVVSAVTWKRTIRPFPRRAAVTSGVPSASRAQVFSSRPGVGSASTCRVTVTSSGAVSPKNGLPGGNGAMCLGVSHDRAPPSWRPPRRRSVGIRSSSPAASRLPAKRSRTPPLSRKFTIASCCGPGRDAHVGERENRRPFRQERDDGVACGIMRFADVRKGLERPPEIVARSEQRLGDVGARAGGDGDASPARPIVDEPGRARRPLAFDHDFRCFVAQFDRQFEAARGRRGSNRSRTERGRFRGRGRRARAPSLSPARARRSGRGAPSGRRLRSRLRRWRARRFRRSRPRPIGSETQAARQSRSRRRVRRRRRSTALRSSARARETARSPGSNPRGRARRGRARASAGGLRSRRRRAARCPSRPPTAA